MPLQWLPLDQSIYKKSPISEAIGSQQPSRGQAPSRQFLGTQDTTNYALERMKQEWAMEDKKKKEERDAAMEKAQEMGLRIMAAKEKEKAQYQQMAQQQQKQQMQQVQQIEENPEPAAKELFQFMQTVDEETRQRLLDQLFTPIKTGSITMGDKTMETPSRYNPIAQQFVEKGWVTFNPKTGEPEFSMPQREFEKGTFTFEETDEGVFILNSATGKSTQLLKRKIEDTEPKKVVDEVIKQVNKDALDLAKESDEDYETVKYNILLDYGFSEDEAEKMAKFKEFPKNPEDKGFWKSAYDTIVNIVTAPVKAGTYVGREILAPALDDAGFFDEGKKQTSDSRLQTQGTQGIQLSRPTAPAAPKFNESNVKGLVPVISDNVTPQERAYLKSQGATDAEIDEAIRRKTGS